MNDTAVNFANALYELARDENLLEEVREQLLQVDALYRENPAFVRLLCAPNLPNAERLAALDEAFSGRVHPYVLSFLKLLCERGGAGTCRIAPPASVRVGTRTTGSFRQRLSPPSSSLPRSHPGFSSESSRSPASRWI